MKIKTVVRFLILTILLVIFTGAAAYAQTYENKSMGISFGLDGLWADVSTDEGYIFQNPAEDFESVLISCIELENVVSIDAISDSEILSLMDTLYSLDVLNKSIQKSNPGAFITSTQNYQTHSRETYNGHNFFRYEKQVTFHADGYNDKKVYYISCLTIANGKLYEFHYERPEEINNYAEFINLLNTVSFEIGEIKILINGEMIYPDSSPVIIDGRTLVPIRAVAEKMGYTVGWDGDSQLVTLISADGQTTLHFAIGLYEGLKNHEESLPLDVPATIFGQRTYLPLRAVAEAMNTEVNWDGETRTVIISG